MGDTNIFADLEIYGELYRPHVVLAPIGDHFTMGHEEAAYAVEMIGAKIAVPIHYGTWPPLVGDPEEFKAILEDLTDTEVLVPELGANFLG
jgi:L-ascorbate metabolism protein UlaG (beta-lactamase superfamily)